jgi:phosphatidylserine decarboxylase
MPMPKHLEGLIVPIHAAGWPFVAGFLVVAVILHFLWTPLFWLGLVATLWCAWFFRDPPRVTPEGDELIVSPADGRIVAVGDRVPPPELELGDRPLPCVSVFLNVFDVHVNRTPAPGRIERIAYRPGKFLNAALDKASEENERQCIKVRTAAGAEVGLVQIAGLVARRIVTGVREGEVLAPGQRVGLIRFGSRCDVLMPADVTPLVVEGQRAIAGETVFADGRGNLPRRTGRRG